MKITPYLDFALLHEQLAALGRAGVIPGKPGRSRLAATPEDKAGRDLLVKWLLEAGLEPHIDAIGNIFGMLGVQGQGGTENALMLGSHIDSVDEAGAYDGCYGVLAALAVARALKDAGGAPRPVVVAAFTNEEGARFQPDMMGSLVHVGGLALSDALGSKDAAGATLGEELAAIGYAGAMPPGGIMPSQYLEMHVEQGPVLDAEGLHIGVVTGVQGIHWRRVVITGTANHAGTTPTRLRRDAGLAAARLQVYLRQQAEAEGWLTTVGWLRHEPDLVNVIPGRVSLTVDIRDPDAEKMRQAGEKLDAFLDGLRHEGFEVQSEDLACFEPVAFAPALVNRVEEAARTLGYSHKRMVSGAGHDAQMLARRCDAAMIFVPSVGGISHNPGEYTAPGDLERGLKVLAHVVEGLL